MPEEDTARRFAPCCVLSLLKTGEAPAQCGLGAGDHTGLGPRGWPLSGGGSRRVCRFQAASSAMPSLRYSITALPYPHGAHPENRIKTRLSYALPGYDVLNRQGQRYVSPPPPSRSAGCRYSRGPNRLSNSGRGSLPTGLDLGAVKVSSGGGAQRGAFGFSTASRSAGQETRSAELGLLASI